MTRRCPWHAAPLSKGNDYFANGIGRGVASVEGGSIGNVKLGWSPVSVFRKATTLAFSSSVNFLPSCKRPTGLSLQVGRAAIPELGEVEAEVEHDRCVDRASLPVVADGGFDVVGTPHLEIVAGVAGDETGLRQARVEIKFFTQFCYTQVNLLRRYDRLDGLVAGGLCKRQLVTPYMAFYIIYIMRISKSEVFRI